MANARPFDLAWARSTVAQCREAGVPVFVKQLGSNPRDSAHLVTAELGSGVKMPHRPRFVHPKGGDPMEWPDDLRVREWPGVSRG